MVNKIREAINFMRNKHHEVKPLEFNNVINVYKTTCAWIEISINVVCEINDEWIFFFNFVIFCM